MGCAQHLYPPATNTNYTWFGVATCMDYGHQPGECETKVNMPAAQKTAIANCIANTTLSGNLVEAMEKKAAMGPGYFPGPYVGSTVAPHPNNDNPHGFVQEICTAYSGTKPKACSMQQEKVEHLARRFMRHVESK